MVSQSSVANVWKRLAAFLIDVLPITILVFLIAYFFTGFRDTLDNWLRNPTDSQLRAEFLKQRNVIRLFSGLLYYIYAVFMECSRFQATIGKMLMRVVVVNESGMRMTMLKSVRRNTMKMFSIIPAFIGCAAAFFHPLNQTWHDRFAHTYVLKASRRRSSRALHG